MDRAHETFVPHPKAATCTASGSPPPSPHTHNAMQLPCQCSRAWPSVRSSTRRLGAPVLLAALLSTGPGGGGTLLSPGLMNRFWVGTGAAVAPRPSPAGRRLSSKGWGASRPCFPSPCPSFHPMPLRLCRWGVGGQAREHRHSCLQRDNHLPGTTTALEQPAPPCVPEHGLAKGLHGHCLVGFQRCHRWQFLQVLPQCLGLRVLAGGLGGAPPLCHWPLAPVQPVGHRRLGLGGVLGRGLEFVNADHLPRAIHGLGNKAGHIAAPRSPAVPRGRRGSCDVGND